MILYCRMLMAISLVAGIFFALDFELNKTLFLYLNQLFPEPVFWLLLTTVGDGLFIGCAFYLVFRGQPGLLLTGLLAGVATHITTHALKKTLQVLRPEHILTNINLFGPNLELTNYSMPSGHTMAIYMAVGFIAQTSRLSLPLFFLLNGVAFLTMLSRVAIGAHWPADCLIGLALGLMIGLVVGRLRIVVEKCWQVNLLLCLYALFSYFALQMAVRYLYSYPEASLFLAVVAIVTGGWLLLDLYKNNMNKTAAK